MYMVMIMIIPAVIKSNVVIITITRLFVRMKNTFASMKTFIVPFRNAIDMQQILNDMLKRTKN